MHEHDTSLPYNLVKRLMAISLVVGLVGGLVGSYAFVRYAPSAIPVGKRQVLLQENSAVIDVVKKVSPSVVSITTESTASSFFGPVQQSGAGTGIIISSDGLILTNKHVASDVNGTYAVFTADGKQYKNAKLVAQDPVNDIAFLRIQAHGLKAAELGDSGNLQVGQQVVAIGNALGQFQNTATQGIISGLGRPIVAGGGGEAPESLQDLIQTDAAINPGNSGGPLVNLTGQVIGLNTAVAGGAQNIGFSIPINEVKPAIDSVQSKGRVVRPYLGVRYVAITKEYASSNNLPVSDGAYVTGDQQNPAIVAGSPAEKAGLKDGDIITKIDGQAIDTNHTLTAIIGQKKVGDKVTLTINRGGKSQTLDLTLEEAPAQ
jgi:serine protease Do